MRYFTLDEAQLSLPEVERHLREALFHKSQSQEAQGQMDKTAQRVRDSGGARVNPSEVLAQRARRDTSLSALKQALDDIEEAGAVVKDLDMGLLDFMTRYRDRDVCLCWRLGEERIAFWHGPDEGFRGRKPIDQEFLQHHHGEAPH
ncbi:MAG TPA: DUF2203 domain-containing protein [Bryobacteraceae bacterium]|jgi:hypothetical protein|nr:DUF2203 domain-containing protein [Bryobacteraceae bacterium]